MPVESFTLPVTHHVSLLSGLAPLAPGMFVVAFGALISWLAHRRLERDTFNVAMASFLLAMVLCAVGVTWADSRVGVLFADQAEVFINAENWINFALPTAALPFVVIIWFALLAHKANLIDLSQPA